MQKLLRIARIINTVNQWIGQISAWLVFAMILVGVWNVAGRYLGRQLGQNLSSNAWIETQWYLFDLVFLLGAAYTLRQNEHVRVDVFYSRWSRRQKAIADLVGTVLFLIPFCILVIWVSWNSVWASWAILETSPDPGGLPRYPIKTMILVSFGLLILQGIAEAIKNWAIVINYAEPEEERHDLRV